MCIHFWSLTFNKDLHGIKMDGSKVQWGKVPDILAQNKLTITGWMDGILPPRKGFNVKNLSAPQLASMVANFLKAKLGPMYDAEMQASKARCQEKQGRESKNVKGKGKAKAVNPDLDSSKDEVEDKGFDIVVWNEGKC
jgi:hypothetical protein